MNAEIFNKPQLNDKILIKRPFFLIFTMFFLKFPLILPVKGRSGEFM